MTIYIYYYLLFKFQVKRSGIECARSSGDKESRLIDSDKYHIFGVRIDSGVEFRGEIAGVSFEMGVNFGVGCDFG